MKSDHILRLCNADASSVLALLPSDFNDTVALQGI
jgi:hypothetical protein